MTWLRVDDVFVDHPKVEALSDAAFRLHVRAMCYCARFRTDGDVPASIVVKWAKPKTVAECVTVGVWHAEGPIYVIHDYLVYNPSKADLDKKALAGAKGAAIRYGKADGIAGASQSAIAPARVPSQPSPDPVPARPSPAEEGRYAAPQPLPGDALRDLFYRHFGHEATRQQRDELETFIALHGQPCVDWVLTEVGGAAIDKRTWRVAKFKFADCEGEGHGPRASIGAGAGGRGVRQGDGRHSGASQRVAGTGVDWGDEERRSNNRPLPIKASGASGTAGAKVGDDVLGLHGDAAEPASA